MWSNFPLFPQRASTLAGKVDAVFFYAVGVTVVFSLLIGVLIVIFAVRYRRRDPDEIGHAEHAGWWLEVVWSIIPLGILLFMFVWGARVYFYAFRPPANAANYYVVGKQWMWKIQHPEGNREINELHVPVNEPIKLTLTSEDVIHSFYLPEFRIKMDAIPGRYTTMWFQATKTGTFHLFCAEYCGAEHSAMIGKVVVMEPDEYQKWLTSGGVKPGSKRMSGKELFVQKTCSTCHRPDSSATAPNLKGVFGHEVQLADGSTVLADENYIRESILNSQAKVVAGYKPIMPTFQGQITEDELIQLIQYVKSLSGGQGATKTPPASPQAAAGSEAPAP